MFGRSWSYHRPFGSAVVDGCDLDIKTLPAAHYDVFAYRLQKLALTDPTKKYLLTAAPQCPHPSIHLDTALTKVAFDAVFVQFYNNSGCQTSSWTGKGKKQLANSGFNFGMWNKWVKENSKNKKLRVFLTMSASAKVAGQGYVSRVKAAAITRDLARFENFGGAAL